MKEAGSYEARGFIPFWCERCQIKVWRPTYWKKSSCPVCEGKMMIHIERKEVNDAQEKKPTETV